MEIEKIARKIVHCAIKVHKALGPGLLESAYQKCMTYLKLTDLNIGFILNWNVTLMKHGIRRMVNQLEE